MRIEPREKKTLKKFEYNLNRFLEQGLFAPFLLSIQPVLQSYLINITELDFSEITRSLLVSLLLTSVVLGVLYLSLRDGVKSALIASFFVLFFFLFGEVANWISTAVSGLGYSQGNALAIVFVFGSMSFWAWLVQNRIKNLLLVNRWFNVFGIILSLVIPAIQLGGHLLENNISLPFPNHSVQIAEMETDISRPDIYYIILDGYGREDILKALYQFDNSDFIGDLEARGFYVASESSSNYIQTLLSMSSSLNMDYHPAIRIDGGSAKNRGELARLIDYNNVRVSLAQGGYRTVSFYNGSTMTIASADIYYKVGRTDLLKPITPIESHILNKSMARVLLNIPAVSRVLIETPYVTHRQYILSTFAGLREIPLLDGDYFVYAHIIAPHPPFVFDENGHPVHHDRSFTLADASNFTTNLSRDEYIAGYHSQIQYINKLVLETIDVIIAKSQTPPIIILQGDHGPGAYLQWESLEQSIPAERFGILNAYYFPDRNYTSLYPSISPVNSFRVLMNQFFNGEYPLIFDRHYYSSYSRPFEFIEVEDLSLP